MSETEPKKRGFFSRLFGREDEQPAPAPASAIEPAPEPVDETRSEAAETAAPGIAEAETPPVEIPAPAADPIAPAAPAESTSLPAEPEPAPVPVPTPQPEPVAVQPAATVPAPQPKRSWWRRLADGLSRTSSALTTGIADLFTKRKLDAGTLEDLEDILIQADLGLVTSARIAKAVGEGRFEIGFVEGPFDAPPVEPVERIYSIDEVVHSARIRDKVRRVDLDTITFATGSAEIGEDQVNHLQALGDAISKILKQNPAETFLIEGHTDAVGSDESNLVLSDERAQSVAEALTSVFNIPAENLTTQGYGERFLKVNTQGPNRENRRVAVRRITPLVAPVASAK